MPTIPAGGKPLDGPLNPSGCDAPDPAWHTAEIMGWLGDRLQRDDDRVTLQLQAVAELGRSLEHGVWSKLKNQPKLRNALNGLMDVLRDHRQDGAPLGEPLATNLRHAQQALRALGQRSQAFPLASVLQGPYAQLEEEIRCLLPGPVQGDTER